MATSFRRLDAAVARRVVVELRAAGRQRWVTSRGDGSIHPVLWLDGYAAGTRRKFFT
jgi:hypothetical protein